MSDVAIRVEGLGKQYHLGAQKERYHTFADQIRKWTSIRKLFSRAKCAESRPPFWALKDVSFEVKRGEVVGIIGRNGAGKSTLLKILSRITEPTEGRADIHGRVGSLLEVGTGFHPELTGRENIFLNGAILGMKRLEIFRKFDEIVSFAEVGKFIDTPTKHYSSGMYMRLAFAVAAHMEPEILVVDEVLAVGDSQFQEKCLGKMGEVAKGGRTVLFVSHSMPAVLQLCSRGLVLGDGRVVVQGTMSEAVSEYLRQVRAIQTTDLATRADRKGNRKLRFLSVTFHNTVGEPVDTALSGEAVSVRLHYESQFLGSEHEVDVAFNLRTTSGGVVTAFANTQTTESRLSVYPNGYFQCEWPKVNLRGGRYDCALYCAIDGEVCDWMQHAFQIPIEDGDFFRTGRLVSRDHGDVLCEQTWASCSVKKS